MKSRVRLLNLLVSCTLVLLSISATLGVLGIFNSALKWDLFGPKLEAVLYGVFGSCMTLAGFGVLMTLVVAIRDVVTDFKRFIQQRTHQDDVPDAPRQTYVARMGVVVLLLAFLVGVCALANHVVLTQRCQVFKRLGAEHIGAFGKKIVSSVESFAVPPQRQVPRDLFDIMKALDDLDFVSRTTLYVPDPAEPSALWGFTAWRGSYTNTDGFAHFYIAKDFEKAMRKALDGNPGDLERLNARNDFVWFNLLLGSDAKPKAVVRLDGDRHQSFREYRLGE